MCCVCNQIQTFEIHTNIVYCIKMFNLISMIFFGTIPRKKSMKALLSWTRIDSIILIDIGRIGHEIENLQQLVSEPGWLKTRKKTKIPFKFEDDNHRWEVEVCGREKIKRSWMFGCVRIAFKATLRLRVPETCVKRFSPTMIQRLIG